LVAPILKDFCAKELKIENPEIAVFNLKNEEDIVRFFSQSCRFRFQKKLAHEIELDL